MNPRLKTALRALARRLPPLWRLHLRRWWHALPLGRAGGAHDYDTRASLEVARFAQDEAVHDLPPVFHYWSNTYLRPQLEIFGFSSPEDFYAGEIHKQAARSGKPLRIVSIGAGNGDSEAAVAQRLRERGVEAFHIECLDLTAAMLQRGQQHVQALGIAGHFRFVRGDFNHWQPDGHYDVVIANQSLHHVTRLEALFDAIQQAIGDDGIFVTSDMIGRNGHRRWPEAMQIVQQFWQELPKAYRYNRQLHRRETKFGDWDCSLEGFEGIRAQDILPLALQRFGFDFFYAYGNLIDPFIDRGFGPHFDPDKEWDRAFIDRVQARDEAEILAGRITPTHMLATLRNDRSVQPRVWRHLTPDFCWRRAD